MFGLCSHNYEIISEKTTKSQLEHAHGCGLNITKGKLSVLNRKYIQTLKCTKCDKVKHYVVDI